jgi:UDP-glucose 4-epimerase
MKILITGGAGFIGSHLAQACQGQADVRVLDNFNSGKRVFLEGIACEIIAGSILDQAVVETAVQGVDSVIHLAALVSVPVSCAQPQECVTQNANGTLNVLQAAARAGVKTFVFASSAAVYGDDPKVPKVETMQPHPKSPYAVTKLDGEYYCEWVAASSSMRTVALRFFNVFGPRQLPEGSYGAAVPFFIRRALRKEPLTIFGDGEQTRDFIYVEDIVSALRFATQNSRMQGVFNCGYGQTQTINQLAGKIVALTGSTSPIIHGPERPGDVRHSHAAVDRLMALGWKPHRDFDFGLQQTINYFRRLNGF